MPGIRYAVVATKCKFEVWRAGESEARLDELLASADVIISGPGLTAQALHKAKNLKLLQCATAGHEWVAMSATAPAAFICNTSSMDVPIAEYVMSAILEWQVSLAKADAELRAKRNIVPPFGGPGSTTAAPFHVEAAGKTLGIIGLGRIGQQVARRAAAFDMRVLGLSARPREAAEPLPQGVAWRGAGEGADLEKLLRESDFVLLCCALTDSTRGLLGACRLAMMKPGKAVVINVGRGPLCDEAALYEVRRRRASRR